MRRIAAVLVGVACLSLSAADQARAQSRSAILLGWIRDSAGKPVPRADVNIESLHAWTRTDTLGFFKLASLDPGKVTVGLRRLGFEPQTFEFTLRPARQDSVSVTMLPNVEVLEAMKVDAALERRYVALAGFYERRARDSGVFLTREDIEQHHSSQLSDALRTLPNLQFSHGRGGRGIRFQSASVKRFDCPPDYWIDGRRVTNTDADDYPTSDIEAVEVYSGPSSTPSQFGASPARYTCGTIVIWTRIPGLP